MSVESIDPHVALGNAIPCSEDAKIQGKTAELQSLQLGFLKLESNNPTVYRLLSILILYLGIATDLLDSCLTAQYLTMD